MGDSTVKVVLRVKPTENETDDSVTVAGSSLVLKKGKGGDNLYQFHFDQVFNPGDQKHVFEGCALPILEAALDGYNGTILAYGQTGSGKTYTMSGWEGADVTDPHYGGLMPRVIRQLFRELRRKPDYGFDVKVSYVEIYNEVYRDLLQADGGKDIGISDVKHRVTLKNVVRPEVKSMEDAIWFVNEGQKNRKVASHGMNQRSSRSHTVFTLWLNVTTPEGKMLRSKLNMVDLAGSERIGKTGVDGEQARQAQHINKSLTFLEQVVVALSKKTPGHVPYRSSKLTHFLKDSLGGNSKTLMIACAWGDAAQINETISTCRFAQRMMKVKVDAKQNGVSMLGAGGGLMRLDPVMRQYLEQMTNAAVAREKQRLYREFSKRGKLPEGEAEGGDGLDESDREELEILRRRVAELEGMQEMLQQNQGKSLVDEQTIRDMEMLRVRVLELEAERRHQEEEARSNAGSGSGSGSGGGGGGGIPVLEELGVAELNMLRLQADQLEAQPELSAPDREELLKLQQRIAELEAWEAARDADGGGGSDEENRSRNAGVGADADAGVAPEELELLRKVTALRGRMKELAKPTEQLTEEEIAELQELRAELLQLLHLQEAVAAAGSAGGGDAALLSRASQGTALSAQEDLQHHRQVISALQMQLAHVYSQVEEQAQLRNGLPAVMSGTAIESFDQGAAADRAARSRPSITKRLRSMFSRRRSRTDSANGQPNGEEEGAPNIVILNSLTHNQLIELLNAHNVSGQALLSSHAPATPLAVQSVNLPAGLPGGGAAAAAAALHSQHLAPTPSPESATAPGAYAPAPHISLPAGLPPAASGQPPSPPYPAAVRMYPAPHAPAYLPAAASTPRSAAPAEENGLFTDASPARPQPTPGRAAPTTPRDAAPAYDDAPLEYGLPPPPGLRTPTPSDLPSRIPAPSPLPSRINV